MSSVLKIVLKEVGKKNGPIKNRNNETEKRFKERERERERESKWESQRVAKRGERKILREREKIDSFKREI